MVDAYFILTEKFSRLLSKCGFLTFDWLIKKVPKSNDRGENTFAEYTVALQQYKNSSLSYDKPMKNNRHEN